MANRFTRILAAGAAALTLSMAFGPNAGAQESRLKRLQDHLYYFASDSLQGRLAGSEYSAKAARYIENQYRQAGLLPFFENDNWEMKFSNRQYSDRNFFNVVGFLPGNDPSLKNQFIVIGAHFDHLGVRDDGEVYNGADDNASGSAALIEVAKELAKNQSKLGRSVIIAGFDGEELGLYGSNALADLMKEKGLIDDVTVMISVDMVGWLSTGGALMMEGTGTIRNGNDLLSRQAKAHNLPIHLKKFETSVLTATDTQGFAEKGIATLDMTTGTKSPYHKVGDDPELIDYDGLDKIVGYISDVLLEMSTDKNFGPSGKVAPKHRTRLAVLEVAPKVGIGSSAFTFDDAELTTGSRTSLQAGLGMKINLSKRFAIEVDGIYSQDKSYFPVEEAVFTEKGKFTQRAISVPAYLLLQHQDHIQRYFIGAGPFYRKNLETSYSSNITKVNSIAEEQYGAAVTFGMGIGKIVFSADFRIVPKAFENKDIKARLSSSYFTMSYWF